MSTLKAPAAPSGRICEKRTMNMDIRIMYVTMSMGCRTNGLLDQWVVELMGCWTIGKLPFQRSWPLIRVASQKGFYCIIIFLFKPLPTSNLICLYGLHQCFPDNLQLSNFDERRFTDF